MLRASPTALEQLRKRAGVLKRAKARCVGRGDVDGEIVGPHFHLANPRRIIGDPVGAVLVRPDIDPDDSLPPPLQPTLGGLEPAVVEAHPVDHRPILGQPEQPRPRIPRLGPRGQGPDLDEAEAEAEHLRGHLGILVEARGEPDRIGEIEPGDSDGEAGILHCRLARRNRPQRPDRQPMCPLRVEGEEEGADERIERHAPSLRGAERRSNPGSVRPPPTGLLRFARNDGLISSGSPATCQSERFGPINMRLTSLADYAVVVMAAAARRPAGARLSAGLLAEETGVPLPTAQKVMGRLAGAGLLEFGARRRRRLPARPAGRRDQPRRHHRGGRGADRDDQLH